MAEKRRATLRITGPDIQQDTVEITEKGLKIGRLAANDLTLKHQKVSRHHADLALDKDGLSITDLGSSNGTRLGDNALEPNKPYKLNVGDSIAIGPFVLTVDEIVMPEDTAAPDKTVAVKAPKDELPATRAVSTEDVKKAVEEAQQKKEKEEKAEKKAEDKVEKAEEAKKAEEKAAEADKKAEEAADKEKAAAKDEKAQAEKKADEAKAQDEPAPDAKTVAGEATDVAPEDMPPPAEETPPLAAPDRAEEPYKPPPPTIPPRVPLAPSANGDQRPVPGLPQRRSSWLQYLPPIYSDDEFTGRFLLIFESIAAPLEWIVDHFDFFLDARYAPPEWLQWFGSWADILVPEDIPEARQRQIVAEMGRLFLSRGTPGSLHRHLELVFGVEPDIKEPDDKPSTFEVTLKLGKSDADRQRKLAERIIEAHRPAHTLYRLTIK